jgi:hypothetical protein
MTPDVIAVKALPDYVIEAQFADGEVRRFNIVVPDALQVLDLSSRNPLFFLNGQGHAVQL